MKSVEELLADAVKDLPKDWKSVTVRLRREDDRVDNVEMTTYTLQHKTKRVIKTDMTFTREGTLDAN